MKRCYIILAMIVSLCVSIAGSVEAMTFNKPVRLGEASDWKQVGGLLYLKGYKSIGEHKPYAKSTYAKADAVFGDEKNNIHIMYEHDRSTSMRREKVLVGDGTKENSVEIVLPMGGYIYQVTTDTDYVFYLIEDNYGPGGNGFDVIGRRPDGKFIKYITHDNLDKTYGSGLFYPQWRDYGLDVFVSYNGRDSANKFVFKWDDKAQWFSVDNVTY